ncbi:hypothetical protein [Plasticicumulans sp.]|uniref:hypothetical protein n=1 Tax=Plasticicumulans sp. TaxID=2307179 RepID=UPI002CD4D164|nr:hypothetical protein [Plasticicumulans sp.]MBS0601820.1 hypothetical protein [Pseudomonadota bacterium]HMV37585.1 hypothetical protein [Plasticicumulans sp.]HMW28150.1 hypothetical protein [Plasticicumulans sp.]HMW40786.1 hypothetical protein [Plasticicumulans sp.]HMX53334.1 hypothetical protein [Plasticicumulans sp.]
MPPAPALPITTDPAASTLRRLRLSDEIAFLESRLAEMGHGGDCAYEHALSRAYTDRLIERRQELSRLLH